MLPPHDVWDAVRAALASDTRRPLLVQIFYPDGSFQQITIKQLSIITEPASSAARVTAPEGPRLRRVHEQLLAAATDRPTPGKQLATRAGYRRCNSHVQTALTELTRWGLLVRTPDGYRLPAEVTGGGSSGIRGS